MKNPDHLLELIGPKKKFSGHVRKHPTNGLLYVVINDYKRDVTGNFILDERGAKIRDPQWFPTGLRIRGNVTRAEKMIPKFVSEYTEKFIREYSEPAKAVTEMSGGMAFADYLLYWLNIKKLSIRTTTYSSYKGRLEWHIIPFFKKYGLSLTEVKAEHIQKFYSEQSSKGEKNSSIVKSHAILHNAFKHAVRSKLLTVNPMDLVIRPKPEKFIGSYYSNEEASRVIESAKDTLLEIPVLLATFYGLRRSEVVGLRWDCFNMDDDVFMIRHTVTSTFLDGHVTLVEEDRAKSEASIRSLPLVAPVKKRLLELRNKQAKYRKLCGKSYNTEYLDYVCVDQVGNRLKPNYITVAFKTLLVRADLRDIRYHDLRHTCASLLLANGVSLKDIQEWPGHSDIQTTARYAHVDMRNKKASANTMLNVISLE